MVLGKFFSRKWQSFENGCRKTRLYISDIHDKNDMGKFLEDISQKSKTAKASLIKVMFLVMMFKRAECEGDWPFDLHVVSKLQSYFSATGHHHYALYATYCLNDMKTYHPKFWHVSYEVSTQHGGAYKDTEARYGLTCW